MNGDQVTKLSLRKTKTEQLKHCVTPEDLGTFIIQYTFK